MRSRILLASICLLTVAAAVPTAPADAQAKRWLNPNRVYPDGAIVKVTGVVADQAGEPLRNLLVELEGSRSVYRWGKMKYEKANPATVSTRTDDKGEYEVEWRWHHYYNTFELRAVVPAGIDEANEPRQVLARRDVTEQVRRGSPAVASLTVQDPSALYAQRDLIDAIESPAQRRVYEQYGPPDKVETVELPTGVETSWWYFAEGKTYVFENGDLREVLEFRPVKDGSR